MARQTLPSVLLLLTLGLLYHESQAQQYLYPFRGGGSEECGCRYNQFANLPMNEKANRECDRTCVYRSINGQCNNRWNSQRGMGARPFGRLLPPEYCSGPHELRCARDKSSLPSARTLSLNFFQQKPARPLDKFLTSAHMVFGQFASHDFGRKNETKPPGIELCGTNECETSNPVCHPIQVLVGDPDFSPNRCLRFQRSHTTNKSDHGKLEQINEHTSYLDLNIVYGSSEKESAILRDPRPEMSAYFNITSFSDVTINQPGRTGKPHMPQDEPFLCRNRSATVKCFLAGDFRVKENPQLTIYHLIFVREHNRLVKELDKVNAGCWSQERLFQEARKINIASYQFMFYNEYIPLFLSENNLDKWFLKLEKQGHTNYYDSVINATTSNVFMTASFRFGHTQIPEFVSLADPDFNIYLNRSFSEHFNNPYILYDSLNQNVTPVDAIALGQIALSAGAADAFFDKQITRSFDAHSGMANFPARDLIALDIKRGRDHGLPGYNAWLKFCGLRFAKTNDFNELVYVQKKWRAKLASLYRHVDDVDLFVAGMMESPFPGDLSGPTFSCLNAEQFSRTRYGDRFWFEERANGFNEAQLQSIRTSTLARIFCDNLDDAKTMQPNILAHPKSVAQALFSDVMSPWDIDLVYKTKLKSDNERVACSSLPRLDMSLWKEQGCCRKHRFGTKN